MSSDKLLEILGDGLSELCRLVIQSCEFHMDVAHRLLEVEVLVYFLGRDTDVTARSEAPIVALDFCAVHEFDQAGHIGELRLRESLREPKGLAMEVTYETKLFNQGVPSLVAALTRSIHFARVPAVLLAAAVFFGGFDQPAQQFEEVISLTTQIARALGGWGRLLDHLAQGSGRHAFLRRR